jgi:hypothetical protein
MAKYKLETPQERVVREHNDRLKRLAKDILNLKYDDIKIDLIISSLNFLDSEQLETIEVKSIIERQQDEKENLGVVDYVQ